MNLIDISKLTRIPVDELKYIFLSQFNRIILSEYNQIDSTQYEKLMEYLGSLANSGIAEVENSDEQSDSCENTDLPVLELECLKELSQIVHPHIKYTRKLLQYCISHHFLLFIDTCSLLNDHFYEFYNLLSECNTNAANLFVPYVVLEELKSFLHRKDKDPEIRKKAEDRISFIAEQCKLERIRIVGDENDKRTNERGEKVIHADRVLIEKLIYFRNDSKSCLLITQDHGITVDALKQNEWQSTISKAVIAVKKIGEHGTLCNNSDDVKNPVLPIDAKK